MKQNRYAIVYFGIMAVVAILETTLLVPITLKGARPDFLLLLMVFFSHQMGSFNGKFLGFFSGTILDIIGMAPLGFHSFLYTVVGHFFGLTKGKVYIDVLTLPVLLAVAASVMKVLVSIMLTAVFDPSRLHALISASTGIEIGLNAVLSPFIFAVLRLFRLIREHESQIY